MEEQSESQSQNLLSEEVRADPVIAPSGLGSDVDHGEEVKADPVSAPRGLGPDVDQGEGVRADPVSPPSGMGSDVGHAPGASSDPNQTDVCAAQASQTPNSMNQTNVNPSQAPNTANYSVSEQRCPGISIAERAERIRIRNYGCQKRQRIIESLQREKESWKRRIDELNNEKNELSEYINILRIKPPNEMIESMAESNHEQGGIVREQIIVCTTEASETPNSINQINANTSQAPSTSNAFVLRQRQPRLSEAEQPERKSDQEKCKEEMRSHVKALTRNESLEIENECLKKENECLKKENAYMNQTLRDQKQEPNGFRHELLELKMEMKTNACFLKGENESLKRESETLKKENESFKRNNALMNQTMDDHTREIDELRDENSKLRQEFSELKEEVQSTVRFLKGENESLKKENELFKRNNALLNQTMNEQARRDESQLRHEFLLQKQVSELQAELAKACAEVVNMQSQQANLVALLCQEIAESPQSNSQPSLDISFLSDNNLPWEPLWT